MLSVLDRFHKLLPDSNDFQIKWGKYKTLYSAEWVAHMLWGNIKDFG